MPNLIELMDNPEKIVIAATRILAKHGHENHKFEEERGAYDNLMSCIYEDIPNKKIRIFGYRDMTKEEELNKFLNSYPESYAHDYHASSSIASVVALYHWLVDVKPGPRFSEIAIYWNEDAKKIDSLNLAECSFSDLENEFYAKKFVFSNEPNNTISFVKGAWQKYLADIYASTIAINDFDGGHDNLGQPKEKLTVPKIIIDLF
ncbi:MAG: hypothetical protein WC916_01700 [Candidatus Woesearchaeota archaeon]